MKCMHLFDDHIDAKNDFKLLPKATKNEVLVILRLSNSAFAPLSLHLLFRDGLFQNRRLAPSPPSQPAAALLRGKEATRAATL